MRLCVVLLFVSDTPRLLIGQHSCMVRVMLPPVAVALLTVHGLVLFLSFFLWCKTVLLLTGSYKQKRKIPVFKKSSCTCGCSLKFTIFWKPSFFQEEDVCVFGTILISAASPDIWYRKTPFKPNTQNLMSWKCGHVKLGEHWNLAAGSSWQQLVTCSRQYPQRLKRGVDDWGIIASISSFGLWAPCVTQTDVSHKCSHAHRNTATFQH